MIDRASEKKKKLEELLEHGRLFFDGGTGSLLQAAGLQPGEQPETWNLLKPEIVTGLHISYLSAGCDIIKTNTFGANRLKYPSAGPFSLEAVVRAGIRCAALAVQKAGRGLVALSLGPTGKLLKPLGDLDFEKAVAIYKEVITAGAGPETDLILIETMSDSYELKAAVLAAKESSDLPVFATVVYDGNGKLLTGGTPLSVIAMLEGLGVDALGINCGLGPVQMKQIAEAYMQYASVPVIVNPNAGLPKEEQGKTVYDISPDEFAGVMEEIADLGVSVLGGCCGTTPEHIKKMTELCRHKAPVRPEKKDKTVVSSFGMAVELGETPIIIGERINPTGKPELKEALLSGDTSYILKEAVWQQERGAHVLDVNAGLPGIDEAAVLCHIVQELQGITELPLQLDTSDTAAMERALRIYNGKALINSVNGKEAVMDAVFPLMRRYGGVAVALTLDENGIPGTAKERCHIAERIIQKAAAYGIDKKDILIDALCLTISADPAGALTTLQTVELIRSRLGVKTILGISNISFGLPGREHINAAFFAMALMKGLNAAIINPCSDEMMNVYDSFLALAALDENCDRYIEKYGGEAAEETKRKGRSPDAEMTLEECVRNGLRKQAVRCTEALLLTEPPMSVIDNRLIPALDRVGKAYEEGISFLPQLLKSAEAAGGAFEVIRKNMVLSGTQGEKRGTVLLAAVKGDIHDIGKNIVRVLLENYSFDVIDMGRDVAPEAIAAEVEKKHIRLVGLSALMTTTVVHMEETIRLLREKTPWVRIMAGGAVLTQEYADIIGADRYCRDAMSSVKYAQEIYAAAAE